MQRHDLAITLNAADLSHRQEITRAFFRAPIPASVSLVVLNEALPSERSALPDIRDSGSAAQRCSSNAKASHSCCPSPHVEPAVQEYECRSPYAACQSPTVYATCLPARQITAILLMLELLKPPWPALGFDPAFYNDVSRRQCALATAACCIRLPRHIGHPVSAAEAGQGCCIVAASSTGCNAQHDCQAGHGAPGESKWLLSRACHAGGSRAWDRASSARLASACVGRKGRAIRRDPPPFRASVTLLPTASCRSTHTVST